MQIVLCSDNHGDRKSLDIILARHPGADLYLHCGDSEFSKDMLMPFASVRGNNDYDYSFPKYRVVETKHHNIFITHGNLYYSNISELTKAAKKEEKRAGNAEKEGGEAPKEEKTARGKSLFSKAGAADYLELAGAVFHLRVILGHEPFAKGIEFVRA